jgi:predicted outer membrane repeat protein
MCAYDDASINFIDCEISYNEAGGEGGAFMVATGAMGVSGLEFNAVNTIIEGNVAGQRGGFLIAYDPKTAINLTDCTVLLNEAHGGDGGAFWCFYGEPTVKNTIFDSNTCTNWGCAAFIEGPADYEQNVWIEGCSFVNNYAPGAAGAILLKGALKHVTIANTTFSNNKANAGGGAIFSEQCVEGSSFNFVNVTTSENMSEVSERGGIFFAGLNSHDISIRNSIMEGNYALEDDYFVDINFENYPLNLKVSNSFIGRIANAISYTQENSTVDYYESASDAILGDFDNETGSYSLPENSPAINYGTADYLIALNINTDQLKNIRYFTDGKCDAGAVETDKGENAIIPIKTNLVLAYALDGKIVINSDKSQKVSVYSIDGRTIYSSEVGAGKTIINGLAKGVYIVNRQKVILK